MPDDESLAIADEAPAVSYGWGMIPATVRIGTTEWDTAMFPKDGRYIVPVKAAVRRAERLEEGDRVTMRLTIRAAP